MMILALKLILGFYVVMFIIGLIAFVYCIKNAKEVDSKIPFLHGDADFLESNADMMKTLR